MKKLSERSIRFLFGGIGIGCFALLLALEVFTQEDETTLLDFVGDAAGILLIIASAVGVALLVQRIQPSMKSN